MTADIKARPTVITVAREAGVSTASVSRVLNGLAASPEMTERVLAATRRLGYAPDAAARSLKDRRTQQLALAVPDIANPVYVRMMRAIEDRVRGAGLRLLVHSTGGDPSDEMSFLESLRRNYVDGFVISSLRITDALLRGITDSPVAGVVIGSVPDDVAVDSVATSSRDAAELAIRHLVEGGRRSIALLNGPEDTGPGQRRRDGYEQAIRASGLRLEPRLISIASDFTHIGGYEAAHRLMASGRPDAVFCANDLLALGALRAFAERGVAVPRDVAVVGLDDTELAAMSTPSLSSVSLFSDRRGQLAAELLLARLADPSLPHRRRYVAPELVVRESSAP